jgi:hypothetical protein
MCILITMYYIITGLVRKAAEDGPFANNYTPGDFTEAIDSGNLFQYGGKVEAEMKKKLKVVQRHDASSTSDDVVYEYSLSPTQCLANLEHLLAFVQKEYDDKGNYDPLELPKPQEKDDHSEDQLLEKMYASLGIMVQKANHVLTADNTNDSTSNSISTTNDKN